MNAMQKIRNVYSKSALAKWVTAAGIATGVTSLVDITNDSAAIAADTFFKKNPEAIEQTAPLKEDLGLILDFSTKVATGYFCSDGTIVDKNAVNQTYLGLTFKDLTASIWTNFEERLSGSHEIGEVGLDLNYNLPSLEIQTSPLEGKVSSRVGFAHWAFPSHNSELKYLDALRAGVNYNHEATGLNSDLEFTHLISPEFSGGKQVRAKVSLPIQLGNIEDVSVSLTPSIQAVHLDNFLGSTGVTAIGEGVELGFKKGDYSLTFSGNHHEGYKGKPDANYGSVKVGISKHF